MAELGSNIYSNKLDEPIPDRVIPSSSKYRRKSYTEKMEQLRGKITVEKVKAMRTAEFINSLKLTSSINPNTLKMQEEEIGKLIYFFEVTQASHQKWIIRRTLKDFLQLDKTINDFFNKKRQKIVLNHLSHINEDENDVSANIDDVERYLKSLLIMPDTQIHDSLMQFLEISAINYEGAGKKYKEVYVKKRSGGRYNESSCCLFCAWIWQRWKKRYFVITSEGVMYSRGHDPSEVNIRESLLFDHNFQIEYGKKLTGEDRGLILNYSNRRLRIVALSLFSFYDILAALNEAYNNSPYINTQRFDSFAPVRSHAECKWYIDGDSYFGDVYEWFNRAREEIFITGWWIAPYMYLKRPVSQEKNQMSRLDHVLKSAAERGVTIKIIVYCESTIALNINSGWTRKVLEALHPNIKVLRHPGNILPILWSHHEKMLVIDQQVGFLGGLDLCYGRMDSQNHPLFEPKYLPEGYEIFPGIDFSNSRKKDFFDVKDRFNKPLINKHDTPRMPWHDVAMQVSGEPVRDMARHFIQYWNFVKNDLNTIKEETLVIKQQQPTEETTFVRQGTLAKLKQRFTNFTRKITNNEVEVSHSKEFVEEDRFHDTPPRIFHSDFHSYPNSATKENLLTPLLGSSFPVQDNVISRMPAMKETKQLTFERSEVELSKNPGNRSSTGAPRKTHFDIYIDKLTSPTERRNSELTGRTITEESDGSQEERKIDQKIEEFPSPENFKGLDFEKKNFSNSRLFYSYHESARISPVMFNRNPQYRQDMQSDEDFIAILKKIKEMKEQELENNESVNDFYPKMTQDKLLNLDDEVVIVENESNESSISQNKGLRKYFDKGHLKNQFLNLLKKKSRTQNEDSSFIRNKRSMREWYAQSIHLRKDYMKLQNTKVNKKAKCRCQMLRSASLWSLGLRLRNHEESIHIAYLALISNAKNHIYIENQFFISSLAGKLVKNSIAECLVNRIKRAAERREHFKVLVIMPLLPGFEGEINSGNSALLKVQLHWQYRTISRGGNSLYEILERDMNIQNPLDYITFYGLRTHSYDSKNLPKTEIIYVHSKLMIIDDKIAIMGSANINDRSMNGNRDSEIAMVVEDEQLINSRMDGENYMASKFAATLRRALYTEHFGLSDDDVIDPLSEDLNSRIAEQAKGNTNTYREVFGCYPDDTIKRMPDYLELMEKAEPHLYPLLMSKIRGNAVNFPLNFLENEKLTVNIQSKEYFVPNYSFT